MEKQPVGADGHPIPEKQGVVDAVMAPIARPAKPDGESGAIAVGVALGADGQPLSEETILKLLSEQSKP